MTKPEQQPGHRERRQQREETERERRVEHRRANGNCRRCGCTGEHGRGGAPEREEEQWQSDRPQQPSNRTEALAGEPDSNDGDRRSREYAIDCRGAGRVRPSGSIGALWYTALTGETLPDPRSADPVSAAQRLDLPPALHAVLLGALEMHIRRHHSAASMLGTIRKALAVLDDRRQREWRGRVQLKSTVLLLSLLAFRSG
ncbi:hypothetical protein [Nannocystis pusilla]|uniref:hypothetical protein n=1 Tax=Nannocystis pusilla TaxID=889268 RepID=UPI003DA26C2F